MSSQPATRLPVRGTRATVFNDENARSTRLGPSRAAKAATTTTTKASKDTAAAADEPQKPSVTTRRGLAVQQENVLPGKRKRGALTETTNDKTKKVVVEVPTKVPVTRRGISVSSSTTAAATEKPSATTTTTSRLRQPLASKSKKSDAPPIQVHEDHADVRKPATTEIQSHIPTTTRPSRRLPTRLLTSKPTTTSTAVAATTTTTRRANVARVTSLSAATTTVKVTSTTELASHKTTASTTRARRTHTRHAATPKPQEIVDDEDEPVHKKRRISSEDNELVVLKIQEEAAVSDPAPTVVKPEDGEPDDLDKDDMDDPLMVSEYVGEIFQYLRKVEKATLANPEYMKFQKELQWRMRGILTDWIVTVHKTCRMLPETLFITVNLIDRFLSARAVIVTKLQLVGITCLLIAAKYEEICAPSIKNLVYLCQDSCTEKDIRDAEKYILKTVNWDLSYPTPITFLRRISKADGFDAQSRTLAKYLVEIYCLEWRMISHPPSVIAAAGMWLARLILDREEWDANLAHYSGYKEAELMPTASLMLNYLLKPVRHENFFNKYASAKFAKASVVVQTWAHDRWAEGSVVDLEAECDQLKDDSRERRLRALAEADGEGEE